MAWSSWQWDLNECVLELLPLSSDHSGKASGKLIYKALQERAIETKLSTSNYIHSHLCSHLGCNRCPWWQQCIQQWHTQPNFECLPLETLALPCRCQEHAVEDMFLIYHPSACNVNQCKWLDHSPVFIRAIFGGLGGTAIGSDKEDYYELAPQLLILPKMTQLSSKTGWRLQKSWRTLRAIPLRTRQKMQAVKMIQVQMMRLDGKIWRTTICRHPVHRRSQRRRMASLPSIRWAVNNQCCSLLDTYTLAAPRHCCWHSAIRSPA